MFIGKLSHSPAFCFTSDMDWANEEAIGHLLSFFKKKKLPLTSFVTHNSEKINEYYSKDANHIGLHPNFLNGSSHGTEYKEIIKNVSSIWPQAKCFRSHSYFDHLHITEHFHNLGFKYDSNVALHLQEGIIPLHHISGLTRFPVFLEDYHFLRRINEYDEDYVLKSLDTPGLKIFNFHPIHTYHNTKSLEDYECVKNGTDRPELYNLGIMDLLEQIVEHVTDNPGLGVFYLDDIYNMVKDEKVLKSEYSVDKSQYLISNPQMRVEIVKQRYNNIDGSNVYATSRDGNLRELEIEFIRKTIESQSYYMKALDIGCGNGYTDIKLARSINIDLLGIDFSTKMIEDAKKLSKNFDLKGHVDFRVGDAAQIEFPNNTFDCVITERCLLNLPTREFQYRAISEIHRILKKDGLYIMVEGTKDGLEILNNLRVRVGLPEIPDRAEDNISSLKFDERELEEFLFPYFNIIEKKYFGLYYLISRVLHPLLVLPHTPKFDAKINEIARSLTLEEPEYRPLGHVVGYVLKKKVTLQ